MKQMAYDLICLYNFIINSYVYTISSVTGTDTMSSKLTRTKVKNLKQNDLPVLTLDKARKTSSIRAPSNDTRCPMIIIIYLGTDGFYYLSKQSNLKHAFHPKLNADVIQRGQNDLSSSDHDLIQILFDISATPLQISTFIGALKGEDAGRFKPKRIYDMNKKTEDLQNIALGLVPDCSDAEKTIAKLET